MKTPFFGSYYRSRAKTLADQQCTNIYPEVVETKSGKAVGAFYQTPGLDLQTTVGSGPIRGFQVMGGNLYTVSGNTVYKLSASFVQTLLGTINTSSMPVSMITDGTNVAIFDGSTGYYTTGTSITNISMPFADPPGQASYQDGFGLVLRSGTQQFFQSNAGDLTTWNASNFSSANAMPTDCTAISEVHREQWVFKTDSTEIWVNAGLTGFAFQRLDGVFIEVGCAAPYSVAITGETLIWLTENNEGQAQVVMAQGYRPNRISTHAIEREIQSYTKISDAIGYCYQQEGHLFYVLTFPTGNATWVYDVTDSQLLGIPLWHRRGAFSQGVINRHQGNAFVFFSGLLLVGDYQNGNIYAMNLNTTTDNGAQRKWIRAWRALPQPTMEPVRFSSLQIDMQTGINVDPSASPNLMLRWSDNDGYNWSDYRIAAAGPTGATSQRVKFNRLGATKRNAGLDRIFELSSTDAFGVGLVGAELQ